MTKPNFGAWFRAYNSAVDDPKVQLLCPHTFKGWFNLLCIASQNKGALPDTTRLAFRLRLSIGDCERLIADLIEADLLEYTRIDGDRALSPKNWSERQPVHRTSAARMRRLRQRRKPSVANVTSHVTSGDADVPISIANSSLVLGSIHPGRSETVDTHARTSRDGGAS